MIYEKRVLALVPARGGSKGIKDKNIYPLCGKPLIAYTVEAAKQSKYIDSVIVSTDSEKIAQVARDYGAKISFLRPAELATDTSKSIDAILHAIDWLKNHNDVYDILVLLQPTSPLRTTEDIDGALGSFVKNAEQPLVSVSEVNDNPILIRTIGEDGHLNNLLFVSSTVRRQDMKMYYRVNGSIYINRVADITENTSFNDNRIPYIIPPERAIDIDVMKDIAVAQYYLSQEV